MKPLVYFDFKEANGDNVVIDKNRLKEILEEVYQAGYNDGIKSIKAPIHYPLTSEPTCKYDSNESLIGYEY